MDIDWTTVIFEAVNFGLLVLIMLRFVFRPVRKILDERREAIAAHDAAVSEREAAAEATRTRYEAELERIDEVAEQRVAEALAEARAQAERVVADARNQARADIDNAEAEVGRLRARTLERFQTEILRLGTDAARRVIRELGASEVTEAFARRAVRALEEAVEGERIRGPLAVFASPDADPKAIEALLRRELGPDFAGVELSVETDEELIGGVRVRAEGHEIEASAGASLEDWYRGLRASEDPSGEGEPARAAS